MYSRIKHQGYGIKSFLSELGSQLTDKACQLIESQLESEVDVWLYRQPYQRRSQVSRQSQASCQSCGSQRAGDFMRNGHRPRQLVTCYAVLRFWLPRVKCQCNGSVKIPFSILKPYQQIWDDVNGELIRVLPFSASTAKWSPDGSFLAAGTMDGRVFLLDADSMDFKQEMYHGERVQSLRWSLDGRRLASVGERYLRVWDVPHNVLLINETVEAYSIIYIGLSPTGRFLIYSLREALHIWDLDRGEMYAELPHSLEVGAVTSIQWAWSPDERQLAYVLQGYGVNVGDLRIWDVGRREDIAVLYGHSGEMAGVSWSPDGSRLLTTGYDGTVHIWRAPFQPDAAAGTTR